MYQIVQITISRLINSHNEYAMNMSDALETIRKTDEFWSD